MAEQLIVHGADIHAVDAHGANSVMVAAGRKLGTREASWLRLKLVIINIGGVILTFALRLFFGG